MADSRIKKSFDGKWMLDAGPHLVAMTCHHKREGACGGCYARAIRFIEATAKGDTRAAPEAEELLNEIRSEAR